MNRIKFVVFALVALGLWAYQLTLIAPAMTERAADSALSSVAAVPAAVALKLESQRSDLQAAVLKVAASGVVLQPVPKTMPKPDAPTAERLNMLRGLVGEALGEKKAQAVVGASNEAGTLVAVGAGEPGPAPEGLDVAAIVAGLAAGTTVNIAGVPHLFYAVPMYVADKVEVKSLGACFVGLPVLPDAKGLVEAIGKELKVSVGISAEGALLASSGDKAALEKAAKALKPGQVKTTAEGSVDNFLGLALPLFSTGPVLEVGSNADIGGTKYRVTAVASTRDQVKALAGTQKFGVGGLAGLLLLTIVVTLLIGGGAPEDEGARMVMAPSIPAPPPKKEVEKPEAVSLPPGSVTGEQQAHAPEVTPDDFQFPSSPSQIAQQAPPPQAPPPQAPPPQRVSPPPPAPAPPAPPAADPLAAAAPAHSSFAPTQRPPPSTPFDMPMAAAARSTSPAMPFDEPDEEGQRTSAYPSFKPPPAAMAQARPSSPAPAPPMNDPFAMAAAQQDDDDAQPHHDDADSTRVAMVPQELIKAAKSSSGMTGEQKAHKPMVAAPSIPSMPRVGSVSAVTPVSEEDRHFQDVFRDFVATREKCGEPADGLTFDKFKAKLLKNKEQLVSKYNCRTVRFQVYVKEGKAALKASPVKD